MGKKQVYHLLNNLRFYIMASSILLSIAVVAWTRLQIPSDQLFYIRTEQLFGWLAIFYWYFALVISPIGYVIGKDKINHLEFARRAIGVSAFYFALLHGAVAVWGQLGGIWQLTYLPSLFKWSLLCGFVAFIILLVMAATSFDSVVKRMTLRRWKWLHRLVYGAGVLAVLHIWLIGTHLVYTRIQIAAFIALVVLCGLELYRVMVITRSKRPKLGKTKALIIFGLVWVVISGLIFMMPRAIDNYHARHKDHDFSQVGTH